MPTQKYLIQELGMVIELFERTHNWRCRKVQHNVIEGFGD